VEDDMSPLQLGIWKIDALYFVAAVLALAITVAIGANADGPAPANNTAALTAVSPAAGAPPSAPGVTPALVRDLGTDNVLSVTEPDPGQFDRAGMEAWWWRYRSRHPTER
jgi:hypothetical protein